MGDGGRKDGKGQRGTERNRAAGSARGGCRVLLAPPCPPWIGRVPREDCGVGDGRARAGLAWWAQPSWHVRGAEPSRAEVSTDFSTRRQDASRQSPPPEERANRITSNFWTVSSSSLCQGFCVCKVTNCSEAMGQLLSHHGPRAARINRYSKLWLFCLHAETHAWRLLARHKSCMDNKPVAPAYLSLCQV